MKAMIFSAGLGTRFKPWTNHHPKALALVNGKSLLQRNVEYLQQYGITDVVVNLHHFPEQVIHAVQQNKGWGSQITFSDERNELLETGGGLLKARSLLQGNEAFITLNVDVLTNLDLGKFVKFHVKEQPLISMAVTDRETSRKLLFNNSFQLCGWQNSATGETRIARAQADTRALAYSCVVVFSPDIFDFIQETGKFSIMDTYLNLAAEHRILGYDHTGDLFADVGKPGSVEEAEAKFGP